jgi:putative nucleotidyltransferase with HDIG domain
MMNRFLSYLRDRYAMLSKIILFGLSIVILVLILPKEGKFKYEFRKGKPWMHQNLIAPFDFAILKTADELDSEKQQLLKDIVPYFKVDTAAAIKQREILVNNFERAWNESYKNTPGTSDRKLKNLQVCLSVFDSIMTIGIIEKNEAIEGQPADYKIYSIKGNVAEEKKIGKFLTINSADVFIQKKLDPYGPFDRNLIISVLEASMVQTLKYDGEKTEKEKESLISKISLTRGMIQTGELIISKGELITNDKMQLLESLRIEYESKLGASFQFTGIITGQVILLAVSLFSLFFFLLFFRKEVFNDQKRVVMILLLIVAMVIATALVVKFNPEYAYIIPICLVPIIVGIFNDTRLALFSHLITIILTGLIVPNSYEFVFLQLFAGIVTILSIVRLERRSQFFLTSLLIFITYSIIYIGMTLIKEGSINEMNSFYFVLFAGSAILTFFSYPVIFVFERIFGLITDVRLLELSNTNNKVLRELALKAPGTFQHSMQMANLAEEAVYEIGGNPLLVRTGAMYHDIGKINEPLFFIENQTTGLNPHDELTYEESAAIIIDHVISGVEKAKKHKLPEQIIDFIRTHHGTRKTEYFYTLAKKANPDEEIDPKVFTYHGPEPFSKETAVLMMADVVEAASRSLKRPDEESISILVENMIDKQMENHQLDNADITLRDIRKIKKIFKKKLMNIYHLRIEYPE